MIFAANIIMAQMGRRGSNGAAWLIWGGVAQMGRRGSDGAAWLRWGGVAQMGRRGSDGAAWLFMGRRGSVGSASACCKAGPSSILGSAPQGSFPTEHTSDEDMERGFNGWRRMYVL